MSAQSNFEAVIGQDRCRCSPLAANVEPSCRSLTLSVHFLHLHLRSTKYLPSALCECEAVKLVVFHSQRLHLQTCTMRLLHTPLLLALAAAPGALATKRPFSIHDDVLAFPQVYPSSSLLFTPPLLYFFLRGGFLTAASLMSFSPTSMSSSQKQPRF